MERITRELIERALSGDIAAQDELVEKLIPPVQRGVGTALRKWRLGPAANRDIHQEKEDLAQDGLIELFENRGSVLLAWDPEIASCEDYVSFIAQMRSHQVLRSPRSQWRESPQEIGDEDLPPPASSPSSEREAFSRDLLDRILICLWKGFKERDRVLFFQRFWKDLSPTEIAERTDVSIDAVYQWISRLRKKAKGCLQSLQNSPTAIP